MATLGCAIPSFTTASRIADGDLDGDGVVDCSGLIGLLSAFGTCDGGLEDLDRDHDLDFDDLLILPTAWTRASSGRAHR